MNNDDAQDKMDNVRAHAAKIEAIIARVTPTLMREENYEELARLRDMKNSLSGLVDDVAGVLELSNELKEYELPEENIITLGFEEGDEVDPEDCHELMVKVERTSDNSVRISFNDRDSIDLRAQDVLVVQHILTKLIQP